MLKAHCLLVHLLIISQSFAYYWRDYQGIVPPDAFEAGKDINGKGVYIGQAFATKDKHCGIFPTSIQRGQSTYLELHGSKKADSLIQILCSRNPYFFEWVPANATHLHILDQQNKLIYGGVEEGKFLNIGRIRFENSIVIGRKY